MCGRHAALGRVVKPGGASCAAPGEERALRACARIRCRRYSRAMQRRQEDKRAYAWGVWLGALACVAAFWIVAKTSRYFVDAPFDYIFRPRFSSPYLLESTVRFLSRPEMASYLAAVVWVGSATVLVSIGLGRTSVVHPVEKVSNLLARRPRLFLAASASVAFVGAGAVALFIVRRAHLIDDERAYAFMADLFAHGRLSLPSPPPFLRNPMFVFSPVWTGKYFPGHALALAPGVWLGSPHIVPPFLACLLVLFIYQFTKTAYGQSEALWSAGLTAVSPFVLATYGTIICFGTAATAFAGFLAAFAKARSTQKVSWALCAGIAIGFLALVRPYDAIALGLPFAAFESLHAIRTPSARKCSAAMVLAALSVSSVLLFYNYAIMGSPWVTPYAAAEPADRFKLGFTQSVPIIDYVHTPAAAIGNLLVACVRLDSWLWGAPLFVGFAVLAWVKRPRSEYDTLLGLGIASFVAFYSLAFAGGTWDTGPTYYFVCVPLIIPLVVRGMFKTTDFLRLEVKHERLSRTCGWLPIVGIALAWLTVAPTHFVHIAWLSREVQKPWELIARSGMGNAGVAIPRAVDRHAPGWALGYPYRIATGSGTVAQLFEPHSFEEGAAAHAYFGRELPIYRLEIDGRVFQETGERVYRLDLVTPPFGKDIPDSP